jgi:hypothetical protein
MPPDGTEALITRTCHLVVAHLRNVDQHGGKGLHTRLFSHLLHPEEDFVFAGRSIRLQPGMPSRLEHVVPCAVMLRECRRLIGEGSADEAIALLLASHWRVARITLDEQQRLDKALRLKSTMPAGWRFESGATLARFTAAGITLDR